MSETEEKPIARVRNNIIECRWKLQVFAEMFKGIGEAYGSQGAYEFLDEYSFNLGMETHFKEIVDQLVKTCPSGKRV